MDAKQKRPKRRVSKLLLGGVVALGPFVGTVWVLFLLYQLLLKVGRGLLGFLWRAWGEQGKFDFWGADALCFIFPVLIVFAAGILFANPLGRNFLKVLEASVSRVPLVGLIYRSLSQFVGAIQGLGNERKFKSVVYVEYPSPGCRLIGFVTGEFRENMECAGVTSVFVPTSPNPLTGFLILVENDKVQPSEMSVEEATKMILSAGLVTPPAKTHSF